jgi:hypothetical protein
MTNEEFKSDWADEKAQEVFDAWFQIGGHLVTRIATALRAERESAKQDTERLDWLEAMANSKGGLLLHDGSESGRTGLGLYRLKRSLRRAVDDCRGYPKVEMRKSEPPHQEPSNAD